MRRLLNSKRLYRHGEGKGKIPLGHFVNVTEVLLLTINAKKKARCYVLKDRNKVDPMCVANIK